MRFNIGHERLAEAPDWSDSTQCKGLAATAPLSSHIDDADPLWAEPII